MSSDLPPPTKRRRETEDESVKQSSRCWFDDGNVILQAERVQVRVHRSVLAYHSEIMKNCFECPQPEDGETVDGCPVAHLPDSAEDIENMCVLLYGANHANLNSIEPSYLMTMIRLGRKYEISTFTKTALTYLRKLFPRELALWRASCPEVAKIVAGSKGFLFDIINLAYENQIPSILPAAFLDLFAHHTLNEIMSGIERPGQRGAMLVSEAMPTCMLSRVTFVDSFYCALRSYWSNYDPETAATSQIDYEIPCQNCKDIHRCAKAFIDFIVCLSEMGRIHCGTIHIPAGLKDLDFPVHLCDHCKVALQTSFKGSSQLWWQCLLELAQLPHQQESKDFDDRE